MDVPPTNPYTIGATVDWQLKSPGLVVAVAFPAICDIPAAQPGIGRVGHQLREPRDVRV
jgi:hypothetical protein